MNNVYLSSHIYHMNLWYKESLQVPGLNQVWAINFCLKKFILILDNPSTHALALMTSQPPQCPLSTINLVGR